MARPDRKAKRAASYLDYGDGSDEEKVEEEEGKWEMETMKVAKFLKEEDEEEEEYAPMPASIKEKKKKLKMQEKNKRVQISLVDPKNLLDSNANNVTEGAVKEGHREGTKEGQGGGVKEVQGGGTDARAPDIPDPRHILSTPSGNISGNVGLFNSKYR